VVDFHGDAYIDLPHRYVVLNGDIIHKKSSETKSHVSFISEEYSDILAFQLYLEESPEGMFATILDFPGHPDIQLNLTATGPKISWARLLETKKATDKDEPISGDIRLTVTPHMRYRTVAYRSIFYNTLTIHSPFEFTTKRHLSLSDLLFKGRIFTLQGSLEMDSAKILKGALEGSADLNHLISKK